MMLVLFFTTQHHYGQQIGPKRQALFFELAGSGGVGSVNYENSFLVRRNTVYTWRVGLSLAPIDKNNGTGIVVPILVNALLGKKTHKIELGVGQGMTITTKGHFFALTTAAIGYRHQSDQSRWFYRVTYTPLISYLADIQYQHWGGVSIGYSFKVKTK